MKPLRSCRMPRKKYAVVTSVPRLKDTLPVLGPALAEPAAPVPAPEDAPLFSIGSPIGPFEYRPARGLRVGNTGLNIGGFTTLEFDREDSGPLEIELDSVNLLLLWEPPRLPWFRGFAELEIDELFAYEDAGGDVDSNPDVVVERLYGDLMLHDEAHISPWSERVTLAEAAEGRPAVQPRRVANGVGHGAPHGAGISYGNESNEIFSLDELKRQAIERAYRLCEGNVDKAAVELGIGRATMYRFLKKYGIKED